MKEPRKYKEEDQEPENEFPAMASEPAVAYQSVDINALRARVIEEVGNVDDPRTLEIIEDVIFELTTPPGKRPCQYTVEEMREKLRKSQEDIKAGRVITWEELQKEWDTW